MSDLPTMMAPKCGANRTNGEGPCRMPAGYGTTHPGYGKCKHHFGNTDTGRQFGARLMIRDLARQAALDRGLDPERVTPEQVMIEELARSYAVVIYLESQTDELSIMWPDWHKVLLAERKHAVDVAKVLISAGVEERQVRVMEVQAQALGGVIRLILDRLDLTPEQRALAPKIVRDVCSTVVT